MQELVGLPFLLENITYYLDVESELTESEFITAVVQQADCGLLLDLTNVYINSVNHGFDPFDFLAQLPLERVLQAHLAGGEWQGSTMIDSHALSVNEEVWCLLEFVLSRSPVKGILIERDQNFQDDFFDLREGQYCSASRIPGPIEEVRFREGGLSSHLRERRFLPVKGTCRSMRTAESL